MWNGSTIPLNWALCDGTTHGTITTPDLRDNFILSSGTNSIGTSGGSPTITIDQMPSHSHGITSYDSGHSHGINDHGHTHNITDNGHYHGYTLYAGSGPDAYGPIYQSPQPLDTTSFQQVFGTSTEPTYIGINNANTNISIQQGNANIVSSISNTGGGNPYMPPYYVLAFIMRIV
jgi:hypothetical protein